MTNKLYILFCISVILNIFNLFDAKQPIAFLQSAVFLFSLKSLFYDLVSKINIHPSS